GIATILEGREIFVLASGQAKAPVVARAIRGPVDPALPASALQRHPQVTWFLDREAARLLDGSGPAELADRGTRRSAGRDGDRPSAGVMTPFHGAGSGTGGPARDGEAAPVPGHRSPEPAHPAPAGEPGVERRG
ncbi:MAG TPA: hypothetical protein VIK99_11050, partial [Thermaerobacter sp.]